MRRAVSTNPLGADRVPRATYRLQLHQQFTLADARRLVPYLHDLGISHIYASPLLKAAPGSAHGYDVWNFQELNPELGTTEDLAGLHAALRRHEMGLILDVVPNHMGIGPGNPWWRDVLANGTSSQYAACFDIDWQAPDSRLEGKVAMPVLAERYHEALARGTIRLAQKEGSLCVQYGGQELPVSNESISALLRKAAVGATGTKSDSIRTMIDAINSDPNALDEFLQMQNYVLTHWRNGDAMLNYRRFFTIAGLAGIRVEQQWVFDQVFGLVRKWLHNGWVDGLRVDHIDGLRRPKEFLQRLRALAPAAPIVVEKILQPGESLDLTWPVEGTTGYDFLANISGLFIDSRGEKPLTGFYREFAGDAREYRELVRAAKQKVLTESLAAETGRLTGLLTQIAARHWECRDFTRDELREAWVELAACMPVYRTYAGAGGDFPEVSKRDARVIRAATTAARQQRPELPAELFDFLEELLLLRRRGVVERDFVLRFQQLTGAVMAKAVEDTAFYSYARFLALNEVGGEPGRFGMSAPAFHHWCRRQQALWPASMSATSTHDTKRGAEVRARLAVLSEMPQEWIAAVRRWSKMNLDKHRNGWPDRKIEYVFYQTLAGAWPLSLERAQTYMQKAAREAKEHTGWNKAAADYEEALREFVSGAFGDAEFLSDVEQFAGRLMDAGWTNSLAQTLVKLTAPGIPDIYQGAELWDLSLTDPDNRRAIDFPLREEMLTRAKLLRAEEAWRERASGMPNLWLIWKVLKIRREYPELFGPAGRYEALAVMGSGAGCVLAFARGEGAVTVVPRLTACLDGGWGDTAVALPSGRWRDALTGDLVDSGRAAALFAKFPVALLLREA